MAYDKHVWGLGTLRALLPGDTILEDLSTDSNEVPPIEFELQPEPGARWANNDQACSFENGKLVDRSVRAGIPPALLDGLARASKRMNASITCCVGGGVANICFNPSARMLISQKLVNQLAGFLAE